MLYQLSYTHHVHAQRELRKSNRLASAKKFDALRNLTGRMHGLFTARAWQVNKYGLAVVLEFTN